MSEKQLPTVSVRLRAARKEKALTQYQLDDAASLTRGYVCRMETGERHPSLTTAVKLADTLDVSLDWLAGRTEE